MIKHTLSINTNEHTAFHDITKEIQDLISKNNIKEGIAIIRTLHTTSSICISENEEGLIKDKINFLKLIIPEDNHYNHDTRPIPEADKYKRKNAFSHLRALLLGSEATISVENNKLSLGQWQSIFFVELDGPRDNRKIEVLVR
jgi:secondary thiamine-phosphate synthase enzyme